MAEPLKNYFGLEVPTRLGDLLTAVHPTFPLDAFLRDASDGFEALELTDRARHVARALAVHLPADREKAIDIVTDSLGPEIEASELTGMGSFVYMPFVYFVADHGLDCFEASMRAQYELTKRFTAEFSIRAYLETHRDRTLARLAEWAKDPNVHVRRLVSEGTRPRLPWAPRLREFQKDPTPVLALLEELRDDPEEYVRRSVANNLNDISKDHPDIATEVAARWWEGASPERRRLVRHGLRTLIKAANPQALRILGHGPESPVRARALTCTPTRATIGDKVRLEVELENPSNEEGGALVDFRIHFVKANGSASPKVFKGAERTVGPGEMTKVRKTISLAQHSTRKHYPGQHAVEVIINGVTSNLAGFELDDA